MTPRCARYSTKLAKRNVAEIGGHRLVRVEAVMRRRVALEHERKRRRAMVHDAAMRAVLDEVGEEERRRDRRPSPRACRSRDATACGARTRAKKAACDGA